MSAIGPIAGALAPTPTTPTQGSTATGGAGGGFGKALGDAVKGLNDQLNSATDQAQALATGQTNDLSGVVMSTEQASVELQVAAQIRNKAVDAYQEIFRMQV